MARVRFMVSAHHNVEDFRPYKISFEDRGSYADNVRQALFLAIKREGDWNGWFDSECGDLGGSRTADIRYAIDRAVDTTMEGIVFGVDFDDDGNPTPSTKHGLVVWCDFTDDTFGFGYGDCVRGMNGEELGSQHTDKYDNKWVSQV